MTTTATPVRLIARDSASWARFLARITRRAKTSSIAQDLLAAGAMVLGISTWGILFALLAG